MMRSRRAFDLAAFASGAAVTIALALPWFRQRPCPLFESCGGWETVAGWEAVGWPLPAVLVVCLLAVLLLKDAVVRRAVAGVALMGLWLAMVPAVVGMARIFYETEGPFVAAWVAFVALTVALASLLCSAWAHIPPQSAEPAT